MLAEGTDEVGGQLLTHIFVTADDATPDSFALFGLADSLRLRLDVLLIETVGGRWRVGERLHLGDESDEKDMRAQIDGLLHIDRKVGVRAASDDQRAITDTTTVGEVGKLINRAPALETKVFEQFKIGLLAEDRDSEASGTLDELGSEVFLAQGHGYTVGLCRNLLNSVADAAIVATAVASCDDEQAVLDIEKRIAHKVNIK